MRKLFTLLLALLLWTGSSWAQIIKYPFSSSAGTYTPLSTETVLWSVSFDDAASTAITIPGFTIDGVTYTTMYVTTNGFLTLGTTAPTGTTYSPISGTGTYSVAIAPYGNDLVNADAGTQKVSYNTNDGGDIVVQWQDIRMYGSAYAGQILSFQARLNVASGTISFVYGGTIAAPIGTATLQVGLRGATNALFNNRTTTTNWAATTTGTTNVATCTFSSTVLPSAGLTFTYTPPLPCATPATQPTLLGLTPALTSIAGSFTAAAGVDDYLVVRSLNPTLSADPVDGTTYTVGSALGGGTVDYYGIGTSFTSVALTTGTLYYYYIFSANDATCGGGPKYLITAPLTGSTSTLTPGNITSIADGLWSATSTWSGGIVPTASDNVIIDHNVNVDGATNACFNLTINSSKTLSCVGLTGVLTVGADLTNTGALDLYVDASNVAGLVFTSATNNTFSSAAAKGATDLNTLTINKGTSYSYILDMNLSALTVKGLSTASVGFLTLTNGTLKISGSYTFDGVVFTLAGYSIPATAGFWLNNANFTVNGQNGSPTCTGLFKMTTGTFNVGTSVGNSFGLASGSVVVIEGGAVNTTGRFAVTSTTNIVNYTQSGGAVTVDKVGHTSTTYAGFDLGTSALSLANLSGGTITVQVASTATSGPRDFRGLATGTLPNITNYTGTTLYLGNALSPATAQTFYLAAMVPPFVITNTTATHKAALAASTYYHGTLTIPTGSDLNLNGFGMWCKGDVVNNGTITGTTASSRFDFAGLLFSLTPVAQSYTGAGLFGPSATLTTNLSLGINNTSGVTFNGPVNVYRVNMFRGNVTNSNNITIGNGLTLGCFVQIGVSGNTYPGGSFDVAPVFNFGTGTYTILYEPETTARTTGPEIPASRSLLTLSINNAFGVTLAGGPLTLGATGLLYMTGGTFTTSAANLLTLTNTGAAISGGSTASYIVGPLARTFAASRVATGVFSGSTLFPVGKDGIYLPVGVDPTTTIDGPVVVQGEAFTSNSGTMGTDVLTLSQDRWESVITSGSANFTSAFMQFGDPSIVTGNQILQAATAAGAYGTILPTSTFASGTPNTLTTTASQILAADYYGYFAYGNVLVSCALPTVLTAADITSNSATIGWTAASPAPVNGYDIYYNTTGVAPTGSTTPTASVGAGVTTYPTGAVLSSATTYYVWVRSHCAGTLYSNWEGSLSFNTLCGSVSVYPFSESFDGTTFVPICWTLTQVSGSATWSRATAGVYPTIVPHTGAGMAKFNSWDYSSGVAELITPALDLAADGYQVSFWMYRDDGYLTSTDLVNVYYNTSPSVTGATLLGTVNRSIDLAPVVLANGWYQYSMFLPAGSAGASRHVIFEGVSDYGNNIYVDDVLIEAPAVCPSPYALNATAITFNSALLGWTSTGIAWQYQIGLTGFTPAASGLAATNPQPVSGLLSSTSYDYYVRNVCDLGEEIVFSPWVGPYTFSTLAACPAPTTLAATLITNSSANLTWTPGGTETAWEYVYGLSPLPAPAGAGTATSSNTVNPISPLTGNTNYQFYVRANCGDQFSSWTGPFTFKTLCDVTALPFSENFDGAAIPDCWTQTSSFTNRWAISTTANAGGSVNEMKASYTSGTGITRLITPGINTTGMTTLALKFKHLFDDYGTGINYKIQSSADGITWTDEAWGGASGGGNVGPQDVSLDIVNNLGATTYIAWVLDGDHFQFDYWYVDNVVVREKLPVDLAFTSFYQFDAMDAPLGDNFDPNAVILNNAPVKGQSRFLTLPGEGIPARSSDVNNTILIPAAKGNPNGSDYPVTPVTVKALITNNGVNASAYTIDWTVGGVAQSTFTGPVIPSPGSDLATLTFSPTARGTFITNGTVNAPGEGDPTDNTNTFRMRVYPDAFTRTIYDNGTDVPETFIGYGAATPAMKAGVRYTAATNIKLAGVDFFIRTEAVTTGTMLVQVRGAGATADAPGAVLYTAAFSTEDYLPSGEAGAMIAFPFGDDAPTIAAGSDYWITVKAPEGIFFPGGAQSLGITLGHSYYEDSPDTTIWYALQIPTEYAWIMRSVQYPPCATPTGLTATGITHNSALLDWTENGTAGAWDLEYGPAGFTLGTGTRVPVTSKPHLLGGLSANTSYDFYVRADCGYMPSDWSVVKQFTTLCNTTFPYTQNFDAVVVPELAPCWTKFSSALGVPWVSADLASSLVTPKSEPNFMFVNYSTTEPKNEWLVTPPFQLNAGGTYLVKFWVKAPGYGVPEQMKLVVSTDPDPTGAVTPTLLWEMPDLFYPDYTEFVIYFTPGATSDYYFSWHAYTEANVDYIALDDVSVELEPCPTPTSLTATNITASAADLGWTESGTATSWDLEYGAPGFTPGTGTRISGILVNPHNLTGLTESTNYEFIVRADCGGSNYSNWSTAFPFVTLSNVPYNNTILDADITGNECFNATNFIVVAGPGHSVIVRSGATANFIAGVKINFLEGTKVELGGHMIGKIYTDTWCPGKSPAIPAIVTGQEETAFGFEQANFTLYPNPTNGNFTLVQKGDKAFGTVKLEVYSMSGERVLTDKMIGEKKHEFRFSDVPAGLYFVKVVADDYVETIKLIKTR